MIDNGAGNRGERIVLAMNTPARPQPSRVAQRLLDIEQQFLPRNRLEIFIHAARMAKEHKMNKCGGRHSVHQRRNR